MKPRSGYRSDICLRVPAPAMSHHVLCACAYAMQRFRRHTLLVDGGRRQGRTDARKPCVFSVLRDATQARVWCVRRTPMAAAPAAATTASAAAGTAGASTRALAAAAAAAAAPAAPASDPVRTGSEAACCAGTTWHGRPEGASPEIWRRRGRWLRLRPGMLPRQRAAWQLQAEPAHRGCAQARPAQSCVL